MRTLTTTLILGACLAVTPPALADDDGRATGRLEATGTGRITAEGSLVVYGLVTAPATIAVVARAGTVPDVRVAVTVGRRTTVRTGRRVAVPRGRARILIDGDAASIRITGRRLALSFAGRADVRLRGRGTFVVDDRGTLPWLASRLVTLGEGPPWRARDDEDDDDDRSRTRR